MFRNVKALQIIAGGSARTRFRVRGGGLVLAGLVALVVGVSVANAQIAYDNTTTSVLNGSHGFADLEGGDQITLAGTCRVVTEIELGFEVPIEIVPVVVRFYANDGPLSTAPPNPAEPGTLLYDSGLINVNATVLGFNTFTVQVPNITVPDTFTWTMQTVGPRALVATRFSPPTVGTSPDFIWQHDAAGTWSPRNFPNLADRFYARVTVGGAGGATITCPGDLTLGCPADTDPLVTGSATAEGCGPVAVSFNDSVGSGCAGQTIARTWSADDGSGTPVTCDQIITVVDGGVPSLTLPADAFVACDGDTSPTGTGTATANDACDASPVVSFSDVTTAGACAQDAFITRTWTATDACGNAVSADQLITVVDDQAPTISNCPADVGESGGFGGTVVSFGGPVAVDSCDANPTVAIAPASGSFFATGVTPVSATATDACGNTSVTCGFDVRVSCFGVNRAKIGTKDVACRGIESIEFTSMDGTEELISLFKAEEGSGGVDEDTLGPSIEVDDGVNGAVTVDTTCAQSIEIGSMFGVYVVSDIKKDFDDHDDERGNEVELRGSFVPAEAFDLATDSIVFAVADGFGNTSSFTIPAGSFEIDGKPEKRKFKFEGTIGGADVKAKLKGCKFEFKAKNAANTSVLTGAAMTVSLTVGPNVGQETIVMEDKRNHLKFKREPKVNCCPECVGIASMQVTSDQGVLVFEPTVGETKLPSNTDVNDGVNGAAAIHTSCSQLLEVGDQFGAYTVSEVIKLFEEDD